MSEFEEAQTVEELRKTVDRLGTQLARAKHSREELVEAVYRAARDASSALDIPKVPKPVADLRRKNSEVAVPVLADWQLAKVTPSYNSEVCEQRINLYADKVVELTEIQRADHPVKHARVWVLGDIVEGELIFPGQAHVIDSGLYRQVTVDGPRIMVDFLRRMLSVFDTVHVAAVIGNHGAIGGRSRRDMDPESNADRMLYRVVQQILQDEERLTWDIPDGRGERNWYTVDRIGEYGCLLAHGDQIRGHAGFPFYGLAKKVWGWATGAVREPFDDVFIGHWHQPTRVTLNRITARVSGSPESDNTYAQEQLAAVGRPSQWLLFAHPNRGVTAEYCVWLDDE